MSVARYWNLIKQAVAVSSSAVSEITYDDKTRTMIVRFTNGRVYEYSNVPQDVYEDFLNSPSKGQHFNQFIAKNKDYSFKELL